MREHRESEIKPNAFTNRLVEMSKATSIREHQDNWAWLIKQRKYKQ